MFQLTGWKGLGPYSRHSATLCMIDGSNIRISVINTVISVHTLCFVQMHCSELEFHPDQFEDGWGPTII